MTCFKTEDSGLRLAVRIALLEEKLCVSGADTVGLAQKIARKLENLEPCKFVRRNVFT
jgi:hypothetical protein